MESARIYASLLLATVAFVGADSGCAPRKGLPDGEPENPRSLGNDAQGGTHADRRAVEAAADLTPADPAHPNGTCEPPSDVHLFVAPETPVAGVPLRVLAVSEHPLVGSLTVDAVTSTARHGGPPYFWRAEVDAPHEGSATATFVQRACSPGENVATRTIAVSAVAPAAPSTHGELWPTHETWSRELEDVYSAWIETLFDAPEAAEPMWPALQDVLRDRTRNLLFDYLGAGEDSIAPGVIKPDCADLPYFLRAYFAFKLGLPFGVSECDRGEAGGPPKCRAKVLTNEDPPLLHIPGESPTKTFSWFLQRTLADRVHSGSARVALDDERSDYYPVPITRESLRPGTIYADPYGHVLVLAKRLPQTTERAGVLFAVDAQPDGTVRRKPFWRGNFLYANQRELGGAGWKRFRPLSKTHGKLVRWSDEAIRTSPDYGDVSQEQATLSPEAFFDAMDDALAPRPVDPKHAMLQSIGALEQQIRTRVDSVDSGREWLATAHPPTPMPPLVDLFETTGTWEDLSTPSRDLRLLVAMDFVAQLPALIVRRPERFALPAGQSPSDVERDLEALLRHELATRSVSYLRTDGSSFTLSLADVLARQAGLEVAYNPNDCVEIRWAAAPGSDEEQTCTSRAPAAQQRLMEQARVWFHERRRPPRR